MIILKSFGIGFGISVLIFAFSLYFLKNAGEFAGAFMLGFAFMLSAIVILLSTIVGTILQNRKVHPDSLSFKMLFTLLGILIFIFLFIYVNTPLYHYIPHF